MTLRLARILAIAVSVHLVSAVSLRAEPLRVLVAHFTGPGSVGDSVMTTLYFEFTKAFDNRGEKGVWILYGNEPLEGDSYDAAIRRASLSSARADVVVWGNVTPYGKDLVVQSYLAVTPISEERTVRPEIWRLVRNKDGEGQIALEVGLPRLFYDFEPFGVPADLVQKYRSPDGVPLYSDPHGEKIVGHIDGAFVFIGFAEDSVELRLDSGTEGWVHLTDLHREGIQANGFSQALFRYLRGDWSGAEAAFERILALPDLPQGIRVDSLLLLGSAIERRGRSGLKYFNDAFMSSPYDRASAQYLILGYLSEMTRSGPDENTAAMRQAVSKLIGETTKLFPQGDPWIALAQQFVAEASKP